MKANKGFTLIEVLISAIILFSAIALIAEILSTALFSSNKAAERAEYAQVVSSVNKKIKIEIFERASDLNLNNIEGSFISQNTEFNWSASRISFLAPPKDVFQDIVWDKRFGLFLVKVDVSREDVRRMYEFKVATW